MKHPLSNEQRTALFRDLFGSPNGQEVLKEMEWFCNGNRSVFVPGDVHATCHRAGKQDVYNWIQSEIKREGNAP